MRTRQSVVAWAFLVLLGAGCQSGVPKGTYESKLGNFTCTVPDLLRPGEKMVEKNGPDWTFVSFTDDWGTLLRIESWAISPEAHALLAQPSRDPHDILQTLFHKEIMPKELLAASKDTAVLESHFVNTAAGTAFFVVVNIPQGSTWTASRNGGPYQHDDSLRGLMIFRQHDYLYLVMDQECAITTADRPVGFPPLSIDRRIQMRLDNLQKTVATMTFR